MLALFLFNLGGYQLFFDYFIHNTDVSIIEKIDNMKYKTSDLVEVKIPFGISPPDWAARNKYVELSGEINYKGVQYNYAEMKIVNDTLYLKCIPNTKKDKLVKAEANYGKQQNDIPGNKKGNEPTVKKASSLSDYNLTLTTYKCYRYGTLTKRLIIPLKIALCFPLIEIPTQPPEAIA